MNTQDYVTVTIAGQPIRLKYTLNAVSELERLIGCGLGEMMERFRSGAPFSALRVLLWAGMAWRNKSVRIEDAGNLLEKHLEDGGDLGSVATTCFRALTAAGWFRSLSERADEALDGEPAGEEAGDSDPTSLPV